ncbi:3-oxoacyl-ACP synthase III family protein [Amycolatopsis alkalitolerans]|uniref:Ketoacyl-ACP synthase III n=1 Tax=Amycolatopsis alkalitolerans TaxID=2547244 RepID=A0A5C4LS93_9PSEU|nr:ketoacyl-ACP synthase III [Amycolatopsis alkalitolerans]TNC19268.1 ketoacyl-ACP synthase III [Amycolatopsis alkalitolerans]
MAIGILGTGSYLPKQEISNAEIAELTGTTEEWILRKTRIGARRFAAPDEATSDLAGRAGRSALADARLTEDNIDFLIVSTSTPDSPQPPTACLAQELLGAWNAAAFDINAVCSGFIYALELAHSLVSARPGSHALVIAADLYSRCVDFHDHRTAVLLGDGAGAAVVGAVQERYGILRTDLASRGDCHYLIRVEAGGTRVPPSHDTIEFGQHFFQMEGRRVREFVLDEVPAAQARLMRDAGIPHSAVAHVIPHQPNGVLLDELGARAGFVNAQTHRTLERYGNVGSASVPLTLDDARRNGALRDGELVLLTAFGGGMSMGHCLLRWREPGVS